MGRFVIELANKSDDADLQKILHDNSVDGQIKIAFQRDPSYYYGLGIEGKFNQVIVVRDKTNKNIVGCGTRSIKPVYINGQIRHIGYLNHLRIYKQYRKGMLVARGYQFLKELHQDKKVCAYLTTLIEDNRYAFRILIGKRAGLPCYQDIGLYYSFAIGIPSRRKRFKSSCDIQRGSQSKIDDIVKFIHENGSQKQFYPFYCKEDFVSDNGYLRDLSINNFYLALKNDKIVGLLAKWDQQNFKQVIIKGYNGKLYFSKPLYNLYAYFRGLPKLPQPNSQLNFFYVSLIAIQQNEPEIFRELIQFLSNEFADKGYLYFLIGLHSTDRLLKAMKYFSAIKYTSRLFLVFWEDGEDFSRNLDTRIPYLDIGTL
ncbi:MAG: hypothetical protein AB1629_06910 [Candidatus Omnitrophota bacterium]